MDLDTKTTLARAYAKPIPHAKCIHLSPQLCKGSWMLLPSFQYPVCFLLFLLGYCELGTHVTDLSRLPINWQSLAISFCYQ